MTFTYIVCILKYSKGPSMLMVPLPPKYAKCLAGIITIINSLWPSTTKHCVICKHTPKPTMKSTTTTQIGLPVTTTVMKIELPKMDHPEICPGIVFFLLIFSQVLLVIYEVGSPHVLCIHHSAMHRLEHTTIKENLMESNEELSIW